ncbi:MAG: hypothetical protein ACFCUG_08870 [Thiotrichales bacterium]
MKTLAITALSATGRAYDIEFPLHPQTRSEEGVSRLVTRLLDTLSLTLAERKDISDGDVLQSLAMTLAVRSRMLNGNPDAMLNLINDLLRNAMSAAQSSSPYLAARG